MFHVKQAMRMQDSFMESEREVLRSILPILGKEFDFNEENIAKKLISYGEQLFEYNKFTQLISRKDEAVFYERHIAECLAVAPIIGENRNSLIVDLGTGAGLPGVPLALLFNKTRFLLVDAKEKRTKFLRNVVDQLRLEKVDVVWDRIENLNYIKKYRKIIVVARAVAPLSKLWGWCTCFDLEKRGVLFAMKGGNLKNEIGDLKNDYPGLQIEILKYDSRLVDEAKERVLVKIYSSTRTENE